MSMPPPTTSTGRAFLLGLALIVAGAARGQDPQDPIDGDEASAAIVGFPFRIGLFGGWHFTSEDIDVAGNREPDLVPGAGPHFGLRLGWRVIEGFALELEGGPGSVGARPRARCWTPCWPTRDRWCSTPTA